MGLLDALLEELSFTEDSLHPEFAQALQGMLGGDAEPGLGVEGLLTRLQQAGYGGLVDSWLGAGTNLPLAPDQVADALGEAETQAMAARAGMTPQAFLGALSEHLPSLVDRLSPNGQLQPAGAGTAREL